MTPEEFRVIREGLGLTQAALSEKLEVNRRTIRRWEDPTSGYTAPEGVSDWMEVSLRVGPLPANAQDGPYRIRRRSTKTNDNHEHDDHASEEHDA